MKANIPDKIYVSRNFSEDNSPHGLWYLNKSEHDVNVEFIRKDALLEWLEERINDGDEEGLMTNQIANLAYKDVIEKLNEL